MCRWACDLTCLQTWLLHARDQNNQALQFSASCINENSPSLFMTSNKAGTQRGLICSWMREAVGRAACLACVWVTELVRDGGREGTSGPQLVCHSLSLLPAAITSDRLGQDRGLIICLWLKSKMWTVPTHGFYDTCVIPHPSEPNMSDCCILSTSTGLLTCLDWWWGFCVFGAFMRNIEWCPQSPPWSKPESNQFSFSL